MDGGEDGRGEELGADGAHVEVHQGRGQRGAAEERRRLLLLLDLDAVQGGEQIRLALVKSVTFNIRIRPVYPITTKADIS